MDAATDVSHCEHLHFNHIKKIEIKQSNKLIV